MNGAEVARLALYRCDQTNNEAEYQGAIAILQHAVSMGYPRIYVYGDSKLIVQQLTGEWECHADHLAQYYEQGLALVRRLQVICDTGAFHLSHVYREYNADADSPANVAIAGRRVGDSVVVNHNWMPTTNYRQRILPRLPT